MDPRDALLLDKEAQKLEPGWNFINYEQHGKDRASAFILMLTEIVYSFRPEINEIGKLTDFSNSERLHFSLGIGGYDMEGNFKGTPVAQTMLCSLLHGGKIFVEGNHNYNYK